MRARVLLIVALQVALALSGAVFAADEAAEKEAQRLFRSAFRDDVDAKKRVELLEGLIKDHQDSKWADDALWVLAEMAHQSGKREQAVQFRRMLLERPARPALESFTRSLAVYADSRVPKALYLLNLTGNRYSRDGFKAIPFDPVPMLLHEDLALDYEAMNMLDLALRECKLAADAAPKGDFFERTYRRRAQQIEEKIELLETIKKANPDNSKKPDDEKPKDNTAKEPKTDAKPDAPEQKEPADQGKEKRD